MLKDKVIFMRKPLMYVFSKNQSSGYNYNAVFVCKSDYGNRILKRIENPAHDEWKPDNWKENNHTVIEGKSAIAEIDKFIADTIAEIKTRVIMNH